LGREGDAMSLIQLGVRVRPGFPMRAFGRLLSLRGLPDLDT